MAENDQPFSDRSFVSPVMRDTEKMAVFPDNRPMQPHVFITNVMNITKEDIDSTFSKLYTPWKPEQPMYTVKDWRRSVMFSELPTSPPVVPSVSDMIHSKILYILIWLYREQLSGTTHPSKFLVECRKLVNALISLSPTNLDDVLNPKPLVICECTNYKKLSILVKMSFWRVFTLLQAVLQ